VSVIDITIQSVRPRVMKKICSHFSPRSGCVSACPDFLYVRCRRATTFGKQVIVARDYFRVGRLPVSPWVPWVLSMEIEFIAGYPYKATDSALISDPFLVAA